MAKPNEPKEIKPKAEEEKGEGIKVDDNMKMIAINLVTTVLICILFLSVTYVMLSNLLSSKLAHMPSSSHSTNEEISEEDWENAERGYIVDMGDFILNLSDVSPRKYLKVNVALEVSKTQKDAEAEAEAAAAASSGGHGHGGGSSEPEQSHIEIEMLQFRPAIRDAIITTLSSKTSAELSTVAGKELAKEQIADSVNSLFAGERDVIRVSFGQFIIQ